MFTVRPARDDDEAALRRVDELTWTAEVSPAPYRPEQAFFGARTSPADVLVADLGGTAVGYALLHQSIPLPSHAHVLELGGLAVDPSQHGRGAGRLLVEAAKAEAYRRGARKLSLRVLGPNLTARRVYEACGFSVEGVLSGEFLLADRLVDDVLMACPL